MGAKLLENNEEKSSDKSRRQAAVALKAYGIDEKDLPEITASGYGKLAEKIVKLAFENGVNVREDKALAQILAAIEVDSEIPSEAIVAVAEILSYVYKVNGTYNSKTKGNHND